MELQVAVEDRSWCPPPQGGPSAAAVRSLSVVTAISWDPGNGDIEGRWGRSRRGAGNWHLFSTSCAHAGLALRSLLSHCWERFSFSLNRNWSSERPRACGHVAADQRNPGWDQETPALLLLCPNPGPAASWSLWLQRGWGRRPGRCLSVLCACSAARPCAVTLHPSHCGPRLCWSESFSSLRPRCQLHMWSLPLGPRELPLPFSQVELWGLSPWWIKDGASGCPALCSPPRPVLVQRFASRSVLSVSMRGQEGGTVCWRSGERAQMGHGSSGSQSIGVGTGLPSESAGPGREPGRVGNPQLGPVMAVRRLSSVSQAGTGLESLDILCLRDVQFTL